MNETILSTLEALREFESCSESYVQNLDVKKHSDLDQGLALLEKYEHLTYRVYQVRAILPETDPFRLQIEDRFSFVSQVLTSCQETQKREIPFILRYRLAWREHLSLFLLTLLFFLSSIVVGWEMGVHEPTSVSMVVPKEMLEAILDKTRWFDSLQQNPLFGGLEIAMNNIKVSFYGFALGASLALGGLVLLGYNGLLIGGVLGFCYGNGFHDELTGFVIGHGPLELSIIVCAVFSGLIVGRVFFMQPFNLFFERFRFATQDAGLIVTGVVPWLVLAAIVEAGISPWPFIAKEIKLGLGLLLALAFWVWTFFPTSEQKRALKNKPLE